MYHRLCTGFFIFPLLVTSVFAGPKIEFDTKTFDCGSVAEGKTDKLDATFIVKNTGDTVLKLESVKPGCGCTVVKYDSLIEPGTSAKIEAQVRIKGYSSGPLSKGITVTSNAQNEQTVRLTIKASIKALVGINESFIDLATHDSSALKTIFLTSPKKDLKVVGVIFKSDDKEGATAWESELKLDVKFKYTATDSIGTDSAHVFKLALIPPVGKEVSSGEFVISTNHREKPTISLRGRMWR